MLSGNVYYYPCPSCGVNRHANCVNLTRWFETGRVESIVMHAHKSRRDLLHQERIEYSHIDDTQLILGDRE